MLLEKIKIQDNSGETIREVKFTNGLNIIYGNNTKNSQSSTNNVGKTTFLQTIDFCLGKDFDKIFSDQEIKNKNIIKQHIIDNQFSFSLDLIDGSGNKKNIKRQIVKKIKNEGYEIKNYFGESPYNEKEFKLEIQKTLFGNKCKYPSLRELLGKFIRVETHQLDNILEITHPSAKNKEAILESIYLSMFLKHEHGQSDLISEIRTLKNEIKKLEDNKKQIKDKDARNNEQAISILRSEIEELDEQKNNYQNTSDNVLNSQFLKEKEILQKYNIEISDLNLKINNLEITNSLIEEKIKKIEKDNVDIDVRQLKSLYEQVKFYNESVPKSLDNLIYFHNTMIKNEIKSFKEEIKKNKKELTNLNNNLNKKKVNYYKLINILNKKNALDEYNELWSQIKNKSEELAILEYDTNKLKELENEIKTKKENLTSKINSIKKDILKENINNFNYIFNKFTRYLLNENYYLTFEFEEDNNLFKFKIGGMERLGKGYKKDVIILFDLSYAIFCKKNNIKPIPQFITNDEVELTDIKKIMEIFKISNEENIQLIIPIIKDKLEKVDANIKNIVEKHIIITLDENNKFFKIN